MASIEPRIKMELPIEKLDELTAKTKELLNLLVQVKQLLGEINR